MSIKLKTGVAYTMIYISGMAVAFREEFIITEYEEKENRYIFRKKGKRKSFLLPETRLSEALLFEGHGLPFVIDSETNNFWGSSKFNFVTDDHEQLRSFIQDTCLNPSPDLFRKIHYRSPHPVTPEAAEMSELFPELT